LCTNSIHSYSFFHHHSITIIYSNALIEREGLKAEPFPSLTLGLALTGLSYVALPFGQYSIYTALAGLVCMFYFFEFTIVSIFPYVSEMVPSERGKWLAFNYTALVIGRLCGALSGPWLWQLKPDIFTLVILSLIAQVLAVILLQSSKRSERKA